MTHDLLYYPNPILRQKAHEVRDFSADLVPLTNRMREIMRNHNGMGLAANQSGDLRRIIIVELPTDKNDNEPGIPFTVLVNPKITKTSQVTNTMQEGCLSVPAVEVEIERPKQVTVTAQSVTGDHIKIRAKGLFARILQHEIDHLNGVLIVDYAKKPKETDALKTIVWGSTAFTTNVLNTIASNSEINITHVVTEPPKPSGRGRELKPTIVHTYAQTLSTPCLEPENLTDERFLSYLQAQKPDLFLVAAYGQLLPPEILAVPRLGCLNIHPSLLPKYRGATPIQAAILAGNDTTGVTIMEMSPQFDTGAILAQSELELEGTETYGDLEPLLAEIGGEMINEIIDPFRKGKIKGLPQDNTKASYAKKIKTEDRWLNLDDPAEVNERKVRAYTPSPNAFVVIDKQPLKILSAHTDYGKLIFDLVQPAGKNPMSWQDFLRGYRKPLQFEPYNAILKND